jgi:hypothetical protein
MNPPQSFGKPPMQARVTIRVDGPMYVSWGVLHKRSIHTGLIYTLFPGKRTPRIPSLTSTRACNSCATPEI